MTELPPSHDIDHAIQLILGASLVNVYPYWYTHILKNEIERLVQEMLVKKNKKWRIEVLRRLPCSQQSYSPGLVSHFGDRWVTWRTSWCDHFFQARPQIWLPPTLSLTPRYPQNSVSHPWRSLRVLGDAFWANQCTNDLPIVNEQYISAWPPKIHACIFWWHIGLEQGLEGALWSFAKCVVHYS